MNPSKKKDDSSSDAEEEDAIVFIYDRREGDKQLEKIHLGGIFNFSAFKLKTQEVLVIPEKENFVIVNTNRQEIRDDKSYEDLVEGDETLYVLKSVHQELSAPTQERVDYIPHYDTLVKSGMYEYYASEGQNPLPFAFAELIDNSLAATSGNTGPRRIEIRLMFDESAGKHVICVLDNGGGMNSRELNNWAIYRLSKFNRRPVDGRETAQQDTPRSLNSDISYFGVGGKQAIFFIGSATRMITRTKECADVHELCISTGEFERREKNKESIYSGTIRNRRPGDNSHIPSDEDNVRKLIQEELDRSSFTAVVITGIAQEHAHYLKTHFNYWCKQLAHIYHYYLHGPRGNEKIAGRRTTASPFKNIDLQVIMHEKGKQAKIKMLHEVDLDMQTLYIRSAASVFEFRAHVENAGVVEGVLRYHPFLYDKETYPAHEGEVTGVTAVDVTEEETFASDRDSRAPRGYRPIFECYWNGRLIPYTTIDVLEWCQPPKKRTSIPPECYNRFSGVLWTNDAFQVSTNKLTFMDLEVKLKDKSTIFNRVILGQEQRVQITRAFHDWIRECHETHDKQIKFINYGGQIKRPELPQKRNQSPWSVFSAIEWDGKVFKEGQLIRTQRTLPVICGTVKRFLLFGDHDGDVFATGGEMEITQEPVSIFGETKIFPLAKLDRALTAVTIKKFIEEEESKLPQKIVIEWPEKDKLEANSKVPAGTTIGAMKVDILSGRGESISKLPGDRRKLLVELKVIWHGNDKEGDKVVTNHVCQHGGKSWPYWFRKMENVTNLGPHTLQLQVLLSDSASAPPVKSLPTHRIKFTVTEAHPEKFTVGMLDNPLRVGVPFQIPLNLLDEFNNPSRAAGEMVPVLSASGLVLSHGGTSVKGNSLIVKGVTALGTVSSHVGKDFNLKVTLPGLEEDSQSLKIRLLPGAPECLVVTPTSGDVTVENGSALQLQVQVNDKAGNVTVQPRLNVVCKLTGSPGLPTYIGDCSTSGKVTLTGADISLKSITKPTKLKARIELQHHKEVPAVEKTITVTPSTRAARIELFHQPAGAKQKKKLEDGQELPCVAGDTLSGLSFRVLDEGERELTSDNSLASRMKVNWVPKVNKEIIKQGNLPDVRAPTSCDEPKYCQVGLSGAASLEFSFTIKPQAGPPGMLKCSCEDPKMRLGEALKAETLLSVADQHGNKVGKLPNSALPEFHVSGEGLLEKEVQLGFTADGNIVIKNIKFDGGPLGVREVKIKWKELECYLRTEVVAGAPQKLKFLSYDPTEPVPVFNNTQLPSPLTVQLCDAQGNDCAEGGVKVVLNTDRGIKLTPTPVQLKTDSSGRATFGQLTVSAPRGMYGIRIKALLGRTPLDAPTLSVRVEQDPSKPAKLNVSFDSESQCVVGELLPEVSASVIAEDDTQMKGAIGKDLVLKIWHTKDGAVSDKPPARATTLYPSRKGASDKQGVFHFRDLKVPDVSGGYCMVVQYGPGGSLAVTSKPVTFMAKPGPPVKLEPESVPPTPTVSNTHMASRRVLVKNLKLQLKDKFDNVTGETLKGKISIKVVCPTDGIDETPALDVSLAAVEMPLVKGAVEVPSLMIKEGTAGKSGQEYLLNFQVQLPSGASPHPIPPFTLAFLFYNDVRKQQQMSQLTKERDHLFETIRTYRSLFDTTRQLINEMQVSVHEASMQEQKLRGELRKQNVPASNLASTATVHTLAQNLSRKRDTIASKPRRQCLLHPGPRGDPEILGKVAHLAQVVDDDVARVLSWHMASDMDCVVTLTTEKAKQVYRDSNGQQQVLPLDSIYRRSLPDWTKPLPHARGGSSLSPPGNPVYARDMLLFASEADNCKLVFGMLLGDTVILDDLDCANKYRQEVVKNTHCPTLLTRTGDRIRSNGKFGGLQNKAPHLDKMRGAVLAAPLPMEYHTLSTQIDQLHAYKLAIMKHSQAKEDLSLQLRRGQTEEMKIKHRECREAEAQLRMIEQRLGMTPTQYDMPASPATMLHTELNTPPSRTAVSRRAARGTGATTASLSRPTTTTPVINGTASTANNASNSPASRTRRANNNSPVNSKRARRT